MLSDGPQEAVVLKGPAESTRRFRVRGLLVAAPCLSVLAVGAALTPRNSGYGTHEQLGLPMCGMMVSTGYPCPTCGLTTSVTATMHGHFAQAARANPFGLVLTAGLAVFALVGLTEAVAGVSVLSRMKPSPWWALWAVLALLAGWAINLAAGLASGRWPMR